MDGSTKENEVAAATSSLSQSSHCSPTQRKQLNRWSGSTVCFTASSFESSFVPHGLLQAGTVFLLLCLGIVHWAGHRPVGFERADHVRGNMVVLEPPWNAPALGWDKTARTFLKLHARHVKDADLEPRFPFCSGH